VFEENIINCGGVEELSVVVSLYGVYGDVKLHANIREKYSLRH
jgi:hypothetical protein